MGQASNVIEQEPEALRAEVEVTRAGLADKLETLEQGIKDTWEGATTSFAEAVASVQDSVESSVQAVQGAVHDGTAALGRALDLRAHVRRHPWLLLGGALLLGVVAGVLVSRARR